MSLTADQIIDTLGLAPHPDTGQHPQVIIPPHHWQKACRVGDWTLVSCTVLPRAEFDGFTLAPPGFEIPGRS